MTALLPSVPRGGTAARTPFVLLVVVLLGSGLITLLLLNSALNQGSFELSKLERKTGELTDEQQALQQEVDGYSAPDALARRARKLGMVPGGNPAFLMPDGTVRGAPGPVSSTGAALSASAGPALGPGTCGRRANRRRRRHGSRHRSRRHHRPRRAHRTRPSRSPPTPRAFRPRPARWRRPGPGLRPHARLARPRRPRARPVAGPTPSAAGR
nr:septum formation initiator family protein [Streptomyces noursei]